MTVAGFMYKRLEYTSCPLCNSSDFRTFALGDCSRHFLYLQQIEPQIRWMKCLTCNHIFTNGYFSPETLERIFEKTNENQVAGSDLGRQRNVSARIIDRVVSYVSHGHWLDVGFGNGSLLFTAQEYGFEVFGLDLRDSNVGTLKNLGFQVASVDISKFNTDLKFDVISMLDVLEHMPFPREGLLAANELLKERGWLLLSMPNTESQLWRDLDRMSQNPYWGELEHYHNFSRSRLYDLLREFGFAPRRYGISERYLACMEVLAQKITENN
jgi:protein O-GlcNAc transferase